ncbi:alpha/beta hydrolase fold domain-containing protein [Aquimarina algiphila]|uniref:alpha/beta hydrolase fold domain-containing protein n=1 Tax=Aquimarina algiphila TaxID=2047982 RepID=UPI00232E1E15|nr:alpha/beta hydrolase [Aquimarina algiphila]
MSLGYSLVKLVLKLKGEKKTWSQDPIDYIKKRRQDVHVPNRRLFLGSSYETKEHLQSKITYITPKNIKTDILLMYCHGGAFVYGPTQENWKALAKIAKETGARACMIDYPKAPEHTIDVITDNVYQAYIEATKVYNASKIILLGDSAGGSLILTLAQRLQREQKNTPNCLIPISPLVDASVTNTKIPEVDVKDIILSLKGVRSANTMCAGSLSLKDPLISPLYGECSNLPPIHLFMATDDILTPDQELFVEKVKQNKGEIDVIVGKGMPHVWPILPIMPEAKVGLQKIITIINSVINDK